MNENQKAKVVRFLNDKMMSDTVFDIVQQSFLKVSKDRDVHNLAASMLAVEKLQEAWKELKSVKDEQQVVEKRSVQIGL